MFVRICMRVRVWVLVRACKLVDYTSQSAGGIDRVTTNLKSHRQVYSTNTLTTSRSAHKSQVVKPGDLVLEACRSIAQFGRAVFVVPSSQYDLDTVADITEGKDLERNGESFVATPVGREYRAYKVRTVCAHQLAGILCQYFGEGSLPPEVLCCRQRSPVLRWGRRCWRSHKRHSNQLRKIWAASWQSRCIPLGFICGG